MPRPQRKSKSSEALKKVNDNPVLIAAIAQLFWSERKVPDLLFRSKAIKVSEIRIFEAQPFCMNSSMS